jgi:hypothetical protein
VECGGHADAGAYMPGGYAPLVRTVVSELSRSAASAADPYESVAALIAAAARWTLIGFTSREPTRARARMMSVVGVADP